MDGRRLSTGVFREELCLPVQYLAPAPLTPLKKFCTALFETALADLGYLGHPRRQDRQIGEDARRWFFGRTLGLMTFEDVCMALGLDPDFVLERLAKGRWWRTGGAHRLYPVNGKETLKGRRYYSQEGRTLVRAPGFIVEPDGA